MWTFIMFVVGKKVKFALLFLGCGNPLCGGKE